MKWLSLLFLVFVLSGCQTGNSEGRDQSERPFIHSVYFWFKEGVTEEQKEHFFTDAEKLRDIEVVQALYTGVPAETTRPIVERSYDFAVIVHFRDLAAHDVYQQHPIHLALLENGASLWDKVMITDVN
ncbi:Dabb family protein [uncultured Roseivirga sp.]|uniref:Dabb family protein n=1 Tax=uncultured Roseivirga sp. TaxID=543088 RepID=UPI000D7A81AE|nr:Dabb family protein [uncultured Roseivirga sp.]PWL24809.1 MAG: transcription-repair coupling factor [Roseivirga sp. XM-24bin3]